MNAIMEATSPFSDAEIRMNEKILIAVGANAGDSWARKMIEHHRGAIEISRQTLGLGAEIHIKEMARRIIDEQATEIAALEKLVTNDKPDPASAKLYEPAIDNMHRAMMVAAGRTLSETFQRKMLEYHRGAIELSDIALANGVTGTLREQVEKTKAESRKELEVIEAKIRASTP